MPASQGSPFLDHLAASDRSGLIPEGVFFSKPSFSSFFPVRASWARVLKPQSQFNSLEEQVEAEGEEVGE